MQDLQHLCLPDIDSKLVSVGRLIGVNLWKCTRYILWMRRIEYRVHFKICLLTYKALHGEQPGYFCSLIATSLPSRSLRSNRGITLSVPRISTNTGARAFISCTPLWNNLPLSVRSATSVASFRRRLNTYLFDLASPPPRSHRCAQRTVDVTE